MYRPAYNWVASHCRSLIYWGFSTSMSWESLFINLGSQWDIHRDLGIACLFFLIFGGHPWAHPRIWGYVTTVNGPMGFNYNLDLFRSIWKTSPCMNMGQTPGLQFEWFWIWKLWNRGRSKGYYTFRQTLMGIEPSTRIYVDYGLKWWDGNWIYGCEWFDGLCRLCEKWCFLIRKSPIKNPKNTWQMF